MLRYYTPGVSSKRQVDLACSQEAQRLSGYIGGDTQIPIVGLEFYVDA